MMRELSQESPRGPIHPDLKTPEPFKSCMLVRLKDASAFTGNTTTTTTTTRHLGKGHSQHLCGILNICPGCIAAFHISSHRTVLPKSLSFILGMHLLFF